MFDGDAPVVAARLLPRRCTLALGGASGMGNAMDRNCTLGDSIPGGSGGRSLALAAVGGRLTRPRGRGAVDAVRDGGNTDTGVPPCIPGVNMEPVVPSTHTPSNCRARRWFSARILS